MKYCLIGKHIDEAKLTVRKAGGNPLEYLKITMNDVIVTKVEPQGHDVNDRIFEKIGLAFPKFLKNMSCKIRVEATVAQLQSVLISRQIRKFNS